LEYYDPVTGQTVPEHTYTEPINITLSIFGNAETLAELKNIDNNWSAVEDKDNYRLFYKNYNEYNSSGIVVNNYEYPKS
jgi:hypothetical protein